MRSRMWQSCRCTKWFPRCISRPTSRSGWARWRSTIWRNDESHSGGVVSNKQGPYVIVGCYSESCTYSSIQSRMNIKETSNGTFVGASATECETFHHDKPERYTCRRPESHVTQYVAF